MIATATDAVIRIVLEQVPIRSSLTCPLMMVCALVPSW